ncbi:hypothetical protein ADUPG1_001932 [Aduncisulcus paluster]|uniref:Uncharacterized protein n=1 Tax=Aduncisulcus paluster TaxID=2918883 RepID=A0ABQ5KFF0_9EUKA|nr:hypothetical protein ADUPG1_001932 [Aduncisulcus paluster]
MCSSEFDDDAFVPRTTSSSTSYSTPMSVSKQSHLTSEFGSQVIIIDEDDDEDEGLEMECDMRHIDDERAARKGIKRAAMDVKEGDFKDFDYY